MSAPLFQLNSPQATRLKAALVAELAAHGLENETLVDYTMLLIANRKDRDQVATELQSIIGDDLPLSFVDFLFSSLEEMLREESQGNVGASAGAEMDVSGDVPPADAPASGLDPAAPEFTPGESDGAATNGGAASAGNQKTPFRLLDKALREATSGGPATSAAAETVKSRRPQPYSVPGRAKTPTAPTATTTTFTVTLAGESSSLERLDERPVRCKFWPDCSKGAECPFHHPTELCPNLPGCREGDRCLFIHPKAAAPCKFGAGCTNPRCTFSHPSPALGKQQGSAANRRNIPCKFSPCLNPRCPYLHAGARGAPQGFANKSLVLSSATGSPTSVAEIPCKFEPFCTKPNCPYLHSTVEPMRRADRAFAVAEAEETVTSDEIMMG
ncbi:hypothetical protein DFJ74DRAFT_693374 [Hyaloraphidium curvatum]|nr:hypothetical protein DFJ74DRAFT_693374 [Hyaloraphidium curvatum]